MVSLIDLLSHGTPEVYTEKQHHLAAILKRVADKKH